LKDKVIGTAVLSM